MDNLIIIIVTMLAGLATFFVNNVLKKGGTLASALVSMVGALILPHFFQELGTILTLATATASYAGMVSIQNAMDYKEMAVISFLAGILFVGTLSAYQGIGGKLGVIGAIACFAWLGFKKVFKIGEFREHCIVCEESKGPEVNGK